MCGWVGGCALELSSEWIAATCADLSWALWRMQPKMQLLIHILEEQVGVHDSPRENWCYCDESEIGHAVRVAERVPHSRTLHRTVMRKQRLEF